MDWLPTRNDSMSADEAEAVRALHQERLRMEDETVDVAQLAKELGTSRSEVRKMLSEVRRARNDLLLPVLMENSRNLRRVPSFAILLAIGLVVMYVGLLIYTNIPAV